MSVQGSIRQVTPRWRRIGGALFAKVALGAQGGISRAGAAVLRARVVLKAGGQTQLKPGAVALVARPAITIQAPTGSRRAGGSLQAVVSIVVGPARTNRVGAALHPLVTITGGSVVNSHRSTSAGDIRTTSDGNQRIRWEHV